ncbi:MAG: GNAT family N-acetyltransferase [Candidatus Puniceispirillaceae bacterium]|jgi:RimJ/RimL family protein N-acetyltransferase
MAGHRDDYTICVKPIINCGAGAVDLRVTCICWSGSAGNRGGRMQAGGMELQITEQLSLRPFRPADRHNLTAAINDWSVTRWLSSVPHPYRIDHADAYLARPEHKLCESAMQDASATLALAICVFDDLVGGLSLVPSARRQGAREFGFWLARPAWGQRIMPAAVQTVIEAVRRHAPETEFVASANHDNLRSQRLIVSLGFVQDGQEEIGSAPLQRPVTIDCFHLPVAQLPQP